MDISALAAGQQVMLEDGSVATVVEPSSDGASVRVRFLEAPFDQRLVGTEAVCTDYEIVGFAEGDSLNSAGSS